MRGCEQAHPRFSREFWFPRVEYAPRHSATSCAGHLSNFCVADRLLSGERLITEAVIERGIDTVVEAAREQQFVDIGAGLGQLRAR